MTSNYESIVEIQAILGRMNGNVGQNHLIEAMRQIATNLNYAFSEESN